MHKYLIFLFASCSLYATTTLTVTLNTDNNPGGFGDVGDLRYCLNSMNQNLSTAMDDYIIAFDSPMTIQLNGILPSINNSSYPVHITIGNSNGAVVTIDGNNGAFSGFFIPTGTVLIQNMIFQNLSAKGGNGGDGISGGGGGMGAGGAIFVPQTFLNGSHPDIILTNVTINSCSAIGGNGGSITTMGSTGGGGGGGYGGNGGDVTLSTDDSQGGGGG
ncbi:MAG: hypothetical protein LLF94_08175 [Chlamydiales bacterium]|nr:hypothetical protein [Chlamydiales bacterium]